MGNESLGHYKLSFLERLSSSRLSEVLKLTTILYDPLHVDNIQCSYALASVAKLGCIIWGLYLVCIHVIGRHLLNCN